MKLKFYISWDNEYSSIVTFEEEIPATIKLAGPFSSLSEAKKILISFLETKIDDTRENLKQIRNLRPEDFSIPKQLRDAELL